MASITAMHNYSSQYIMLYYFSLLLSAIAIEAQKQNLLGAAQPGVPATAGQQASQEKCK